MILLDTDHRIKRENIGTMLTVTQQLLLPHCKDKIVLEYCSVLIKEWFDHVQIRVCFIKVQAVTF